MLIVEYKKKITEQLFPLSGTARMDAELLLMYVLNKTRAQLITDSMTVVSDAEASMIDAVVARRLSGEPIAYILGYQPFWTLELLVSPDTLIPRPETECLIDWILTNLGDQTALTIADLGTGTGAIALALGSEKSGWKIDAIDESYEALAIAKKNADKNNIKNVSFYQGDWCNALPNRKYDVIVSNPPYIAEGDLHLKRLTFEPQSALVSGSDGLDAIQIIATQAKAFLKLGASLVIEHGFDQAMAVCDIFRKAGYDEVHNHRDLSDVPRFVTGRQN
ncbi:MAG: peptide chain release factor N(5)-glutamine methyltransferase [Coxiellaceae bacterium]|nr:peptide chain release factor N(5)-glutamine methyltransferase [Coxiellaceae bacterium]